MMIKKCFLILFISNGCNGMQQSISIENDSLIESKIDEEILNNSNDVVIEMAPTIKANEQLNQRLDRVDIVLRNLVKANKSFQQSFICLGLFTAVGFLVLLNKINAMS